jgi:hypothetical protein
MATALRDVPIVLLGSPPGFIPRPETFSNFSMKRSTRIPHYWNEWKVVQCGDSVTSTRSRYRGPLATGGKTWVLQIAGTVLGKRFRRFSGIWTEECPESSLPGRFKSRLPADSRTSCILQTLPCECPPGGRTRSFQRKKSKGLAKEGTGNHDNGGSSSSEYSDEINSPFIRPAGQGFTFRSLSETGSPPSG